MRSILIGVAMLFACAGHAEELTKEPTADEWRTCSKAASLECFQKLSARLPESSPSFSSSSSSSQAPQSSRNFQFSRLDELWPARDDKQTSTDAPSVLVPYKPTYLLTSFTHAINNQPSDPKPENNVSTGTPYDQKEAKFQISLKTELPLIPKWLGLDPGTHSLWFAYTQQSQWQIFDGAQSRPFRENNYEPEFIYSYHFLGGEPADWQGMKLRFANLGFVHQSNGRSLPYSRSWNRVYAQLGAEQRFSDDSAWAILVRPWIRIRERYANDDNPDISSYLGYGDLELRYWWDRRSSASLLARKRSIQLSLTFPFINPFNTESLLNWHLQYFNGYGESLIDYNHRHRTFGIGVSLPFPEKTKASASK